MPGRAWAAPRRDVDADWIPSPEFLADLPRQMQALGVPGIGIAVVEAGRLAWSRGFGVMHAQQRTPVTDATLFEVASLSKPVFAYAVLQLADRGYLLRTGNIVATGTGADLAADNSLFDSFIGLEAQGREA